MSKLLPRKELKFQNKIIDSYKAQGGTGRKWATDTIIGPPDLIVSLPNYGVHLIEVKHRPEFGNEWPEMPNPMEKIQRHVCSDYVSAGGLVLLFVIGRGEKTATNSVLFGFRVHEAVLDCTTAAKVYYHKDGYDIRTLLAQMKVKGKTNV